MMWKNKSSVSENYSQELSGYIENTSQDQQLTDLNLLLNKHWKRMTRLGRLQMTARFDTLPFVEGDAGLWQFVIGELLAMIILHPPKGSFFLHIKCEQLSETEMGEGKLRKKGFKNFQIFFKTNVVANDYWHKLYDGKLKEIEVAVNKLKGAFSYDCCIQNGCIFSIVLPGKQD